MKSCLLFLHGRYTDMMHSSACAPVHVRLPPLILRWRTPCLIAFSARLLCHGTPLCLKNVNSIPNLLLSSAAMCAASPSLHVLSSRAESALLAIVNALFLARSDLSVACTADESIRLIPSAKDMNSSGGRPLLVRTGGPFPRSGLGPFDPAIDMKQVELVLCSCY